MNGEMRNLFRTMVEKIPFGVVIWLREYTKCILKKLDVKTWN
jgi:hypothetical protein